MSFLSRKNRLKELGQQQSIEPTFEREIEILELSFSNVEPICQMANTEGWEIISTMMREEIDRKKNKIYADAHNPVGNEKTMMSNWAIISTLERIINLVEGAKDKKKHITKQLTETLESET